MPELSPVEAPAQKLRHRMFCSSSDVDTYIALNIVVILTQANGTKLDGDLIAVNDTYQFLGSNICAHVRTDGKNTLNPECTHSSEEITAAVDQRTCCLGNLFPLTPLFFFWCITV